MLNKLFSVTF